MFFRALLMTGVLFTFAACSSDTEYTDIGEIQVEEREDITVGPLEGTEVYDRQVLEGPATGTQQDLVVNVGDRVFFGYDRFDLTSEARETLNLQAEWLRQHPEVTITIEGHCDERGTREYNLALGEKRANSIRGYLAALGIDERRMTIISFGKERPAVLGSDPTAWAQNRRGVTVVD